MLGADDARHSVREGYFWSDQYDTRLQFTGTVSRDPVIELLSGRIEDDRFVAACGDGDRITGIFAVGSPRDFVRASVDLSAQQTTGVN
jgi:hypothetical protein